MLRSDLMTVLRCLGLIAGLHVIVACAPRVPADAIAWNGQGREATAADGVLLPSALPPDIMPEIARTYRFAIGDELTIRVLGFPEYTRSGLSVDGDGHIHYLDVQNIPARGCSVPELKASLERALGTRLKNPVIGVEPTRIVGHRYYMYGKVMDKGAFTYDRPLRILDAVARARGLETGLVGGNTVEIADLDHAFMIRNGAPLNVDFRALYERGDMRHNIYIHPGDVLCFPSTVSSEVFVYGAVLRQGSISYSNGLTMLGLLTRSGGLLERAYQHGVVVMRGGLAHARIYTVDVASILAGGMADMPILPGDIIYVHDRPFETLREISSIAIRAFIGSFAGSAGSEAAKAMGIRP